MANKADTITVRVKSGASTFHVKLVPQTEGAMGAEITGAYTASITLGAGANGGFDARQCLAMLADQAKLFAKGTIVHEDLPAAEQEDAARAIEVTGDARALSTDGDHPRPTLEELEAILDSDVEPSTEILPNGGLDAS